jgi:hypothetical protein
MTVAYMNQERKQKVAAAVKPILAKYGMKGSLSVRNHSTIVLKLTSGPIDFIGDMNDERNSLLGSNSVNKDALRQRYNLDVNTYWYTEHYTGAALTFLHEIIPAMKSADWFDKSDAQIDYFHTAYYIDVNVGSWDKPYVLTGQTVTL